MIKTIFNNKWLSLKSKKVGNSEYIYSHSTWCNSQGVAVLGYRDIETDGGFSRREYLGRYEICPAHSDDFELCSITGGCDVNGESVLTTAVRELKEEGGYAVDESELIELGVVNPSKSSDNTIHLFAVDLTEKVQGEIIGDNTEGEEGAYVKWVQESKIVFSKDPLIPAMIKRLEILSY